MWGDVTLEGKNSRLFYWFKAGQSWSFKMQKTVVNGYQPYVTIKCCMNLYYWESK